MFPHTPHVESVSLLYALVRVAALYDVHANLRLWKPCSPRSTRTRFSSAATWLSADAQRDAGPLRERDATFIRGNLRP
jgi:hypothetical protein